MALQGTVLQDMVGQLLGQRQQVNDKIAAKQQELQALLDERQRIVGQISDLRAYITAQGG